MIRRISKHCDLKDIIKSCPSGVVDDIYAIEYYIQGNNVVINASFTQVGNELVVVLPTSQLELLPNGILMRRAFYKVVDTSYPDGYYNLEFEDNMNIWLGEEESEEPVIPEYVTEDELSSTLSSYATQDWVSSQQFLTSESLPSDLATQSWVRSYTYDSSTIDAACGKAEDNAITWVQEQGYLTASTIPSDIATQSWVSSYFYTKSYIDEVEINNDIRMKAIEVSLDESYATMSWVQSQGYLTVGDLPSGLATQSWVESYTYDKSIIAALVGKAQGDAVDEVQTWVSSQQFATQDYVLGKCGEVQSAIYAEGYITDKDLGNALDGYATESWVQEQGYLTQHQDLTGYATQSWVESYTYDKSMIAALIGKAQGDALYEAQEWVLSQSYLTVGDLPSGLATQSWVESYTYDSSTIDYACGKAEDNAITWVQEQGYLTQHQDLTGYATESWVQSQSYLTSASISTYVTESAIESMGFATQSWVSNQGYLTSVPSEYATESFVTSALSGYATESWVQSQGYLTSVPSEYATQEWVESQSYLSTADFSSYATQSWVSSNFLDLSKIWTGTQSQWDELTADQQSFYTIALITV